MEKLKTTAAQVEELKTKLAEQEIELQIKNDAADRLIEIIGVETEIVQNEKGIGNEMIKLVLCERFYYTNAFIETVYEILESESI